jgi:hypothetical protein
MRNVMYSVEPFRTKEVHSQVTFQKKKKKKLSFRTRRCLQHEAFRGDTTSSVIRINPGIN